MTSLDQSEASIGSHLSPHYYCQALALQGERWKNGRNGRFPEESNECLPNFEVFNENEILETSNDLDDSEISLFIEENRNVLKYNRKYKN